MSWEFVIDTIKEWVLSLGYLTTSYVHNLIGNGFDFEIGDFTKDGTWHNLNLAGIIPEGTKAVHIVLRLRNGFVNKSAGFATPGELGPGRYYTFFSLVAGIRHGITIVLTPSSDRKITYYFAADGWQVVQMKIQGWWL